MLHENQIKMVSFFVFRFREFRYFNFKIKSFCDKSSL